MIEYAEFMTWGDLHGAANEPIITWAELEEQFGTTYGI
jgi:hypothetical protein